MQACGKVDTHRLTLLTAGTAGTMSCHTACCSSCNTACLCITACACTLQSACTQVAGTCLANSLDDLTVADLARVAAGSTPLYLVGRYGGGVSGSTQASHLAALHLVLAFAFCRLLRVANAAVCSCVCFAVLAK